MRGHLAFAESATILTEVPRPRDLPDYAQPPIDEVVIGLQFQSAIAGFSDAHTGRFWTLVSDLYRKAESQPRIESQPEVLDGPPTPPPPLPLFAAPQGGRIFLISDDDTCLLQVQNNRFYRNWRRREDDYPHFDDLAEAFARDYRTFCSFVADVGLVVPDLRQIEVTYINWIGDLAVRDFLCPGAVADIAVSGVDEWPEDQTWTARYLVRSDAPSPVARLHVQCVPALRLSPPGPTPGSQMSLTVLAPWQTQLPWDAHLQEVLAMARHVIVRTFTELTTDAAHVHWGRTQ
jgi:uncharacterized protein (TIGR04255 family)